MNLMINRIFQLRWADVGLVPHFSLENSSAVAEAGGKPPFSLELLILGSALRTLTSQAL
jgi:hypothetical protein